MSSDKASVTNQASLKTNSVTDGEKAVFYEKLLENVYDALVATDAVFTITY